MLSLVVSRWPSEPSESCGLKRASIAFLMDCFPAEASVQGGDRYAINLHVRLACAEVTCLHHMAILKAIIPGDKNLEQVYVETATCSDDRIQNLHSRRAYCEIAAQLKKPYSCNLLLF